MRDPIDKKESPEKRKKKERKAVSQTVGVVGSTGRCAIVQEGDPM